MNNNSRSSAAVQSQKTSEDGALPTVLPVCQLPKAECKACLDNYPLYSLFPPSDYMMYPGRNFLPHFCLKTFFLLYTNGRHTTLIRLIRDNKVCFILVKIVM